MATVVICHGANSGGWSYQKVKALLERAGHQVFTPTYTGLGERAHLAHAAIDLSTHIQDVLNVIQYEDLQEIILVGHSYGGAVASGVAEKIPERIAELIYLDALVLRDGEAVKDLFDPLVIEQLQSLVDAHGDGWKLPVTDRYDDRQCDQPIQTFFQPLSLKNEKARALKKTYIDCTEKEQIPVYQGIFVSCERVRKEGWRVVDFTVGHIPNVETPTELAELLNRLL